MYKLVKWLPLGLLAIHIGAKTIFSGKSLILDVILYNLVWLISLIAITQSPLSNDPIGIATISLAIGLWGCGSILNSYGDFFTLPESSQLIAQLSYTLFYPLAFIGIPRLLYRGRKLNPIELLDSAIFGLGISSIITYKVAFKFTIVDFIKGIEKRLHFLSGHANRFFIGNSNNLFIEVSN
mgnify:CR=1 FL=1